MTDAFAGSLLDFKRMVRLFREFLSCLTNLNSALTSDLLWTTQSTKLGTTDRLRRQLPLMNSQKQTGCAFWGRMYMTWYRNNVYFRA